MEYELQVGDGPFQVILTTAGAASVKVFTQPSELLRTDPRIADGMNMLFDHSRLDLSEVTTEQVRTIAGNTGGEYQGRGGRIAIVLPEPASFGLGRMWQSLTGEDISARTRVVTSVETSYEWLESEPD
jgi:hypothetical protein